MASPNQRFPSLRRALWQAIGLEMWPNRAFLEPRGACCKRVGSWLRRISASRASGAPCCKQLGSRCGRIALSLSHAALVASESARGFAESALPEPQAGLVAITIIVIIITIIALRFRIPQTLPKATSAQSRLEQLGSRCGRIALSLSHAALVASESARGESALPEPQARRVAHESAQALAESRATRRQPQPIRLVRSPQQHSSPAKQFVVLVVVGCGVGCILCADFIA